MMLLLFTFLVLLHGLGMQNIVDGEEELFEGDISGMPYYLLQDSSERESMIREGVQFSAPVKFQLHLWPNATIPYRIHDEFSTMERNFIEYVMKEIHRESCVKFVKSTKPEYHLAIKKTGLHRCSSDVGYRRQKKETEGKHEQNLVLHSDCVTRNGVLHELMHTVGFFHEHNRPDRDQHITIHWENIDSEKHKQFKVNDMINITYFGTDYDVTSVLHYDPYKLSINEGSPIFTSKVPGRVIEAAGLSQNDIKQINKLYKCLQHKIAVVPPPPPPLIDNDGPTIRNHETSAEVFQADSQFARQVSCTTIKDNARSVISQSPGDRAGASERFRSFLHENYGGLWIVIFDASSVSIYSSKNKQSCLSELGSGHGRVFFAEHCQHHSLANINCDSWGQHVRNIYARNMDLTETARNGYNKFKAANTRNCATVFCGTNYGVAYDIIENGHICTVEIARYMKCTLIQH